MAAGHRTLKGQSAAGRSICLTTAIRRVNLHDFGLLKASFGTRDSRGDCSGDGVVDLFDFGNVKSNFSRAILPSLAVDD